MIKIKNSIEYNELRRGILGGKVTSIWERDDFFKGARSFPIVNFNYITSDFADFEKNIFNENQKMIYHLSGYGINYNVISCIKKFSKYAGFLNITLPEFEKLNLEVVRISIPELLPLCLPSYPPYYHKRYKEIGEIRNNVPHPLA